MPDLPEVETASSTCAVPPIVGIPVAAVLLSGGPAMVARPACSAGRPSKLAVSGSGAAATAFSFTDDAGNDERLSG